MTTRCTSSLRKSAMEHKIPHALAAKRSTITIILLILIKVCSGLIQTMAPQQMPLKLGALKTTMELALALNLPLPT